MELHLDDEQLDLLRELLDHDFRDLRFEIADTDNSGYKRGLRSRAEVLSSILDQIGGPLADRA